MHKIGWASDVLSKFVCWKLNNRSLMLMVFEGGILGDDLWLPELLREWLCCNTHWHFATKEHSLPQYDPARELLPETEQICLPSLRLPTSSTVNIFLYRFYIDFFINYLVLGI